MVDKDSEPKVKENLDITDELIAERRTSTKMPEDMIPWMAKTIEFIDSKMLLSGKIIMWITIPLIYAMIHEVIGRHFFNRPTLWSFDISRMLAGALFMLGASYTLSKGIHIRADFLYRNWTVKNQARVDLFLYLLFFIPGFLVFFYVSFDLAILLSTSNSSFWFGSFQSETISINPALASCNPFAIAKSSFSFALNVGVYSPLRLL